MRKRTERDFTDSNTDESNKPEKREREKRQPFQVNPTSVSNHGGVGLYSNKGFKQGQRLPFRYPGIHLSKEKFEQLNDFLFALQKHDFFVGDMVSVNLSRLKNYRDFMFSHMDGIVERIYRKWYAVSLIPSGDKIIVEKNRLTPVRGPDYFDLKAGDDVEILEIVKNEPSWWEAIVVKPDINPNSWLIKWKAKYDTSPDEEIVESSRIRKSHVSTEEAINYLRKEFGILIMNNPDPVPERASSFSKYPQRDKRYTSQPNWTSIYDTLIAYRYGLHDGGDMVWSQYDWTTGNIVADRNDPANFALYMNEPPPFKEFYNIEAKRYQSGRANVKSVDLQDKNGTWYKGFEATQDINPGDEALLCYLFLYRRIINEATGEEYDINLNDKDGCGASYYIEDFPFIEKIGNTYTYKPTVGEGLSDSEVELLKNYLNRVNNYKDEGELFTVSESS